MYITWQDQYRYIYEALCEALHSSDFYYSAPDFSQKYSREEFHSEGIIETEYEVSILSLAGFSMHELAVKECCSTMVSAF